MQCPWIRARVGHGTAARRLKTVQPSSMKARAVVASFRRENSSMSAPAMNPAALPEWITSALGGADWKWSRTRPSSSSTSRDSRLRELPAQSMVSQVMPSGSVVQRKWRRSVDSRCMSALFAEFDQHGAALAAADADGGQAPAQAPGLQGAYQVQHDARARGPHRMALRDRAAIHVQPVHVQVSQCAASQVLSAPCFIAPGSETA